MRRYKLSNVFNHAFGHYTRTFAALMVFMFLSIATLRAGTTPKTEPASFSNSQGLTNISISVPAKTTCGLSYLDAVGAYKMLKFEGLSDKSTTVTQSVELNGPTTFVWGFLQPKSKGKPGLSLTKFTLLAKPGDNINLSLNGVDMFLSVPAGEHFALLADNTASFYTESFGDGGKKLNDKASKAAFAASNKAYMQKLNSAYQKENDRLSRLRESGIMDPGVYESARLYAEAVFYDKMFILLDESGSRPDAVMPLIKDHLPAAEKFIKAPNLVLSGEVMRVMTGIIKAKLITKGTGINLNDFLNLYEEGKTMDLGIFKSTFLTYCLSGYPAKQLANYQNVVAEFGQSYATPEQSRHLNALVQKSTKALEFPAQAKFTTAQNQSYSINDIVNASPTSVVVIDFWASWCAPCRQQFPIIDSLKQVFKLQALPVTFISINLDDNKANWLDAVQKEAKYLQEHSYYLEKNGKKDLVNIFDIKAIPHTIVLRDGKVVANDFTLPAELSFPKDLTALVNQQKKTAASPPLFTSRQ